MTAEQSPTGDPSTKRFDVAFVGGGLSSCLIARYLKLKHPELEVLILEKDKEHRWSPGESIVSIAGFFFVRDLGLSTYMYLNHLPKNGLRFFFHNADTTDISQCSEIGANSFPFFPTFQLDRKRVVEDLWGLNREVGVTVQTGAAVEDFAISDSGGRHKLVTSAGVHYECDWLIHAAGRPAKISQAFEALSPSHTDHDHNVASAWGRYDGIQDIDSLGDDAWKQRVGYTSRYLSTNHFMGEGYWIWAIPIGRGTVSMGVVYDKDIIKDDLQDPERFDAFLRREGGCKHLMPGATRLDFQKLAHLPFKRERFCSTDKWAIIGEAFMFMDPLYSPGMDIIAREARHIEHLVTADDNQLPEVVDALNGFILFEYDFVKNIYVNQYRALGSYEVFNLKSLWDFHGYTNRLLWPFVGKRHEELAWLKGQAAGWKPAIKLYSAVQAGFVALYDHLKANNQHERLNRGEYSLDQNRFKIEEMMLRGTFNEVLSIVQHRDLYRYTVSKLVEHRFGLRRFSKRQVVQQALNVEPMTSFELNEGWVRRILEIVREDLASKTGVDKAIALSDIDNDALFDAANAGVIWNEPASNVVDEALYRH